jgi:SecD/SecF fusion protein
MSLRDVQIIPNDTKSELVIKFRDTLNRETLSDILLIQGHVNFYETMNRQEVLKCFGKQTSGCVQDAFTFLHLSDSIHPRSESVFGIADTKDTSSINSCFSSKEVRGKVPDYVKLLWTVYPGVNNQCELYCISSSDNTFNEQNIKEAHADFKNPELPELCITFKETVWQSWKDATLRNMNKPIALVIDNKVYFAPRIMGEIPHGKISLTGHGLSKTEIRKLVAIMTCGTLPLKFTMVSNN